MCGLFAASHAGDQTALDFGNVENKNSPGSTLWLSEVF